MKKITYNEFGGIDVLKLADVEVPVIGSDQLLVKVKAASINPLDWKIREGEMKMQSGSKFPKGVGMDFSGVIEKVGESVGNFKPGDAVFGTLDVFTGGALAEYVVAVEKDIALKPDNISFELAAALPIAGSSAVQIFEQLVNLKKGAEILINGASGGIGSFAIQIAKKQGAIVNAVASGEGLVFAKKLGSDVLIDYKNADVLKLGKRYDLVLDLAGKLSYKLAKKIMKPSSTYVMTVPGVKEIIGSFFINLFSKKKYRVLLLKPTKAYLVTLAGLAKEDIYIEVSKVYPLTEYAKAYTEVPKGGILGKAVFKI